MDIIDLHCDTLYRSVTENMPFKSGKAEAKSNRDPQFHKLQCYAIWIPDSIPGDEAEALFRTAYKRLQKECTENNIKILKPNESLKSFREYQNTAFFTVENGSVLNGKLENVALLSDCGVRMMTLTWNAVNAVGSGADVQDAPGLSIFGRDVVFEMEKYGIIVDISHASQNLFYDVAEISKKPFVASHSNSYSVTPHRRNLTDEQFRIIVKSGGLVGINFHNAFLNSEPEKACIDDIIRHTEHFLSLGGENTICFGSDFDGGTLPNDFSDSSVYDKIYDIMCKRNYKEALIKKIFHLNAYNFFENFDIR